MKHMIHSKFTNIGGKLRSDKNSGSDSLALPQYTELLYNSSKNDKEVYYELYKKMSTICVANYLVTEDKKMKKTPWESLSGLLSESEKKLSDDSLTKDVMVSSIVVLDELAKNTKEFEKILSSNVIKHFHDLSDDNSLTNTKKSLTSLSKEVKANTDKVQSLLDQINASSMDTLTSRKLVDVGNISSTETKLASAQTTEEISEKEWECKKDLYLTKLFAAEAERFTTAEKILEFFQGYLDHYTECQQILTKCIPDIKTALDKNRYMYAFHAPLEEHLSVSNRKLSFILETCIQELDNEDTLQHEGLFRISGGKSKMELLKSALNVNRVDEFTTKGCESSVFAGVLKQYLRELPIPLMTFDLYDKWCEVGAKIRQNDIQSAMSMTQANLRQLPHSYFNNLEYLMQFLKKIADRESINKMSASNIGLVIGPNLIRNRESSNPEDSEASARRMLGSPGGTVLEFMITHFKELFPDAPVYATAPGITVKVSDLSMNEKELTIGKSKPQNDNDSLSSGDMLLDDHLSSTGASGSDNQRLDQQRGSFRETSGKPRSFRKAPAPPPPPQIKSEVPEAETDTINELVRVPSDCRPKVKKRTSILEKPVQHIEAVCVAVDAKPTKVAMQRPTVAPTIPSKKADYQIVHSASLEKPTRPDVPPVKRPSIPPPPIPSFDKLKENLEEKHADNTKQPTEKRKQSFPNSSEKLSPTNVTTKHKYSSSDVSSSTF